MNNNTEFSCLNFSSNIHYYMSSFSIYSMLLLSNRNIIPRDYSASEFVLTLSKCEEAKIYFNYLLHKLIILTRGCGSMNFPLFYAEVKERDLPVIQAAIIDKIDKLIGRG